MNKRDRHKKILQPGLLKAFSWSVIISFLMEGVAFAAPASLPSSQASVKTFPLEQIIQSPSKLPLPLNAVSLKEYHAGNNGRMIIHIQDAHSNYSGQMNLAHALESMMNDTGFHTVLVEGSSKEVTLRETKKIADRKTWKVAANKLLLQGLIAGEEYLNLTSDLPVRLMGMEYEELYNENLKSYSEMVEQRTKVVDYLLLIRRKVEMLKNSKYPPSLLDYEKTLKETGDEDFQAEYSRLIETADAEGVIPDESMTELVKLKELRKLESSMDFELVNRDQGRLIALLRQRGLNDRITEIIDGVKKNTNPQNAQQGRLIALLNLAEGADVELLQFPYLVSYQVYLDMFSKMNLDELLIEIGLFEDQLYRKILKDDDSKRIRILDRYLGLLEKAYEIKLSSDEFSLLRVNRPDFETADWQSFMNRMILETKGFEELVPFRELIDQAYDELFRFYEVVDARDAAFLNNADRIMNELGEKAAYLVAGGYHTAHLTKLMREQGYSYVVLTPYVEFETDHERYESVLLQALDYGSDISGSTRLSRQDTLRSRGLGQDRLLAAARLPNQVFGISKNQITRALAEDEELNSEQVSASRLSISDVSFDSSDQEIYDVLIEAVNSHSQKIYGKSEVPYDQILMTIKSKEDQLTSEGDPLHYADVRSNISALLGIGDVLENLLPPGSDKSDKGEQLKALQRLKRAFHSGGLRDASVVRPIIEKQIEKAKLRYPHLRNATVSDAQIAAQIQGDISDLESPRGSEDGNPNLNLLLIEALPDVLSFITGGDYGNYSTADKKQALLNLVSVFQKRSALQKPSVLQDRTATARKASDKRRREGKINQQDAAFIALDYLENQNPLSPSEKRLYLVGSVEEVNIMGLATNYGFSDLSHDELIRFLKAAAKALRSDPTSPEHHLAVEAIFFLAREAGTKTTELFTREGVKKRYAPKPANLNPVKLNELRAAVRAVDTARSETGALSAWTENWFESQFKPAFDLEYENGKWDFAPQRQGRSEGDLFDRGRDDFAGLFNLENDLDFDDEDDLFFGKAEWEDRPLVFTEEAEAFTRAFAEGVKQVYSHMGERGENSIFGWQRTEIISRAEALFGKNSAELRQFISAFDKFTSSRSTLYGEVDYDSYKALSSLRTLLQRYHIVISVSSDRHLVGRLVAQQEVILVSNEQQPKQRVAFVERYSGDIGSHSSGKERNEVYVVLNSETANALNANKDAYADGELIRADEPSVNYVKYHELLHYFESDAGFIQYTDSVDREQAAELFALALIGKESPETVGAFVENRLKPRLLQFLPHRAEALNTLAPGRGHDGGNWRLARLLIKEMNQKRGRSTVNVDEILDIYQKGFFGNARSESLINQVANDLKEWARDDSEGFAASIRDILKNEHYANLPTRYGLGNISTDFLDWNPSQGLGELQIIENQSVNEYALDDFDLDEIVPVDQELDEIIPIDEDEELDEVILADEVADEFEAIESHDFKLAGVVPVKASLGSNVIRFKVWEDDFDVPMDFIKEKVLESENGSYTFDVGRSTGDDDPIGWNPEAGKLTVTKVGRVSAKHLRINVKYIAAENEIYFSVSDTSRNGTTTDDNNKVNFRAFTQGIPFDGRSDSEDEPDVLEPIEDEIAQNQQLYFGTGERVETNVSLSSKGLAIAAGVTGLSDGEITNYRINIPIKKLNALVDKFGKTDRTRVREYSIKIGRGRPESGEYGSLSLDEADGKIRVAPDREISREHIEIRVTKAEGSDQLTVSVKDISTNGTQSARGSDGKSGPKFSFTVFDPISISRNDIASNSSFKPEIKPSSAVQGSVAARLASEDISGVKETRLADDLENGSSAVPYDRFIPVESGGVSRFLIDAKNSAVLNIDLTAEGFVTVSLSSLNPESVEELRFNTEKFGTDLKFPLTDESGQQRISEDGRSLTFKLEDFDRRINVTVGTGTSTDITEAITIVSSSKSGDSDLSIRQATLQISKNGVKIRDGGMSLSGEYPRRSTGTLLLSDTASRLSGANPEGEIILEQGMPFNLSPEQGERLGLSQGRFILTRFIIRGQNGLSEPKLDGNLAEIIWRNIASNTDPVVVNRDRLYRVLNNLEFEADNVESSVEEAQIEDYDISDIFKITTYIERRDFPDVRAQAIRELVNLRDGRINADRLQAIVDEQVRIISKEFDEKTELRDRLNKQLLTRLFGNKIVKELDDRLKFLAFASASYGTSKFTEEVSDAEFNAVIDLIVEHSQFETPRTQQDVFQRLSRVRDGQITAGKLRLYLQKQRAQRERQLVNRQELRPYAKGEKAQALEEAIEEIEAAIGLFDRLSQKYSETDEQIDAIDQGGEIVRNQVDGGRLSTDRLNDGAGGDVLSFREAYGLNGWNPDSEDIPAALKDQPEQLARYLVKNQKTFVLNHPQHGLVVIQAERSSKGLALQTVNSEDGSVLDSQIFSRETMGSYNVSDLLSPVKSAIRAAVNLVSATFSSKQDVLISAVTKEFQSQRIQQDTPSQLDQIVVAVNDGIVTKQLVDTYSKTGELPEAFDEAILNWEAGQKLSEFGAHFSFALIPFSNDLQVAEELKQNLRDAILSRIQSLGFNTEIRDPEGVVTYLTPFNSTPDNFDFSTLHGAENVSVVAFQDSSLDLESNIDSVIADTVKVLTFASTVNLEKQRQISRTSGRKLSTRIREAAANLFYGKRGRTRDLDAVVEQAANTTIFNQEARDLFKGFLFSIKMLWNNLTKQRIAEQAVSWSA